MKEYEIVATYLNGCAGEAHPQTEFIEAELNDPADYVRQHHGNEFEKFTREDLPDGRVIFTYDHTVRYIYEFTEI
ncbi:MAG: hypothetical protein IKK00_02810 [Oscillospiraceae bacterium]|nr:hypothetical protein [Oscillospiraceae bacterium]